MARKAIQCDLKKHKVAKLFYVLIGPYYIIRNTGYGSYFVKKFHKPDSPEFKFMAYDLYPFPYLLNFANLSTPQILII